MCKIESLKTVYDEINVTLNKQYNSEKRIEQRVLNTKNINFLESLILAQD